jgi:pyridoxamine 5'-phosphate oxidase
MVSLNTEEIPAHPNPLPLFTDWFEGAIACDQIKDATAMTLSTVDSNLQPWSRIVLLKEHNEQGFTFFTNSTSIKGKQLVGSAKVSLCFYWPALDQQIRIVGSSAMVTPKESDAYFATRPRESQIGAWASLQSTELDTRQTLMDRVDEFTNKFEGQDVPRPDHWNGYRVTPTVIEFWLSRPHRLHERIIYTVKADGTWSHKGLYP